MVNKSRLSEIVGTTYYISPEGIMGKFTNKSDVWSCGVILYMMLCGRPPFNGRTDEDTFRHILKAKVLFKGPE